MTQHQIPRPAPNPIPAEPPQQNRHTHLYIVAAGAAVLAVSMLVLVWPTSQPSAPTTHTVVYQVEADSAYGSGRTGMVTSQGPDGGTSQRTGFLPMTGTYTQFHAGDFVYISVQNQQGAGSVTCRITVDGVVVSENTASGGYTIATCQGTVPR